MTKEPIFTFDKDTFLRTLGSTIATVLILTMIYFVSEWTGTDRYYNLLAFLLYQHVKGNQ